MLAFSPVSSATCAFSAASSSETYIIVGDFNQGALANFPDGEEIRFTFDDITLATDDMVKIIGTGKASVDGSGNTAYGLGWIRYIQKVYKGAYPFRVGTRDGRWTTGFYKASALEKIQEYKTKK